MIEGVGAVPAGTDAIERLLDRAAGYLRGESLAELDEVGERIYSERVAKRVYPMMRAVVAAHQAHGHSVVMSTSALTIHAEPVARALGISHVVCNNFELDDNGLLTGRIARPIVGPAESRCGPTVLRRERCRVGAELLLRRRERGCSAHDARRASPAGQPTFRAGCDGRRPRLAGAGVGRVN